MHKELLPITGCANRLLRMLGEDEYRALMPKLRRVRLAARQVVGQPGAAADSVYFPCGCVLSVLTMMADGTMVETGTVGREGFAGTDLLLGGDTWHDTVVCQVEGDCVCLSAEDFAGAVAGDTGLRRATQRFLITYLGLVAQSAACNRLHKVEERFARWMLMICDRVGGEAFYLTQEYIAQMLGVQRPSVSTVASAFQHAGLIRYARGRVTILDRHGLEQASCECYAVCARQIEEVLRPPA